MEASEAAEGSADAELEAEIEANEDLVVQTKVLIERERLRKKEQQQQEKNKKSGEAVFDRSVDCRPEALVDLGCGVFSKARLDTPDRLSVCIGAGVYVDLALEEVEAVVNRRISLLREELSNWMKKRGEVHGHALVLQEAQQILQYVSGLSADGLASLGAGGDGR
ncbi:Protein UXT-like [Hondaea fermentalgiana]|uniref:Protein UXT-like n=1 Tax=Hondaea fermentalgiana TaxID=2315210 RepID=A0A2R5GUA6_9STRA|nr:Protein UXT-like [Hondaea fermentalgiana]|eukprot:GBG34442.1 Protein UXT-like [Hondaea fermentalgiana]